MVWAFPRSLATTCGIIIIFFSYGYLDVSVPHVRSVHSTVTKLHLAGLPHSDIAGSLDICSSPTLFAAYHVFLRLREPRHPPCALAYFLQRALRFVWLIYTCSSFVTTFCFIMSKTFIVIHFCITGVENNGFEPLTPCVQGRCSSQLS